MDKLGTVNVVRKLDLCQGVKSNPPQGTHCHITALYSTVLYSTVLYSTVQYCTVQYCTVQYCTVQYCTVQYCTVQYCTLQYCTIQYCHLNNISHVHSPHNPHQKGNLCSFCDLISTVEVVFHYMWEFIQVYHKDQEPQHGSLGDSTLCGLYDRVLGINCHIFRSV